MYLFLNIFFYKIIKCLTGCMAIRKATVYSGVFPIPERGTDCIFVTGKKYYGFALNYRENRVTSP
jgi:hypothetical protein